MNRNGRIPNNKDIAMYGQSYLYEKFARKYGVIPAQVDAITEISVIFPSVTINANKYEVIARTAIAHYRPYNAPYYRYLTCSPIPEWSVYMLLCTSA